MLQNKINKCRILIADVNENKATEVNNQNIAKNNNTFFDAYVNSFLSAVKSYNIICKYYSDFCLSPDLKTSYEMCEYNTCNIFSEKKVINPIKYKKAAEDLNKKMQEAWTEYIKISSEELKDNLSIIRLVYLEKGEISKLLVVLNRVAAWPVDEQTIKEYFVAKEKAIELMDNIKFDSEIQTFLRKVRDKEATLYDLTEPVRKWLVDEGLEQNITIGIK